MRIRKLIAIILVCVMTFLFSTQAFAEKSLLSDGNEVQWIERVDSLPKYAERYYSWLEQNSTYTNALLLNPTKPDFTEYVEGIGYLHNLHFWYGTMDFTYTDNVEASAEEAILNYYNTLLEEMSVFMPLVWELFNRDHPEVFWLTDVSLSLLTCEYGIESYANGRGTLCYDFYVDLILKSDELGYDVRIEKYQDLEFLSKTFHSRDEAIDSIIKGATGTRYQKIQYLNKWLTEHNAYNSSSDLSTIDNDCYECISALFGRSGTEGPVCEGYARAFKVLCDKLEIPCVLVEGTAYTSPTSAGEPHMWNYVQMEDKNWYLVDITWNDPIAGNGSSVISGYEGESYLLVGNDTVVNGMSISQSHVAQNMIAGLSFNNGPQLYECAYDKNEGIFASGTCGDNITWTLDQVGVLTISGRYVMDTGYYGKPWQKYASQIKEVVVSEGITEIGMGAFASLNRATKITIAESVIKIGEYAFSGCESLKEINISKNVTEISLSIGDCNNLEAINVHEENPSFASVDGVLFNKDKTVLIKYPENKSDTRYLVPETVITVENSAMFSANNLKTVIIPASVTYIGIDAMTSCSKLTEIIFEGNAPSIMSFPYASFADVTATAYYPVNKEGWTESFLARDYEGIITWVKNDMPFRDVIRGKWYFTTVKKVSELGLMTGSDEVTFSPEDPMTRAMVVSVLHRMAGKPKTTYQQMFTDVKKGQWYTTPVIWAATNKIVSGFSNDNTFRPNDNITREQVAVIIRNYMKSLGIDTTKTADLNTFKDNGDVSSWAKSAIGWAVENGIMSGTTDGYLNPQKNATRAECAKMLLKAYEMMEANKRGNS